MTGLLSWFKKHSRFIATAALAFVLYGGVAMALTWPLVTGMNRYYFSPEVPGDGAGAIADSWYRQNAPKEYVDGKVTRFFAYPFGYDLGGARGYPLDSNLRDVLTRFFGAQASYNLLLFFSFPLAGIMMFFLLYYLTRGLTASFLGGFLYAFSPWHTSRTFDQVSLTGIHTLPLFLLALIVFWRRRDAWSAAGLAAASVIAVYTDLHFGLFCAFIALAWVASALFEQRRLRGKASILAAGAGSARKAFLLTTLVIAAVAVASIPVLSNAFYRDPAVFPGEQERGGKHAAAFAANPWNYFVPPAHALVWRGLTDDFVKARLGLRTSNEVTAYPGIVTCALVITALVLMYGHKRRRRLAVAGEGNPAGPTAGDGADPLVSTVVLFCIVGGICAFILSLPPSYQVGSVKIPTPSVVLEVFLPFFRYFCRWAIVVTFCLCVLAGIGFHLLRKRFSWSARGSLAICVALVSLFAIDVTIIPPLRSREIRLPSSTLNELAGYPSSEPIAIYPLAQGYEYATLHYRYFQRLHLHPMLNGIKPATEADLYRLSLKDIYSPYTPKMLAGLGIKKVVVLDEYFSNKDFGNYPYGVPFEPDKMPSGYKLARRAPDGFIYDVVAEPAKVFPLYYSGFTPPSVVQDGRSWTVMKEPSSVIRLVNKGPGTAYVFTVNVANPDGRGNLSFKLDGKKAGEVTLQEGSQRVSVGGLFLSIGNHDLSLVWDGKPVAIDGTPFRAGDNLSAYLLLSDVALQQQSGR